MKTPALSLILGCGLLLGACHNGEQQEVMRELVISKVPTANAIAASTWFMGCRPKGGYPFCKECQVTLHQRDEDEYIAEYIGYASLYEHQLTIGDEPLTYVVTSTFGATKFTGDAIAGVSPDSVLERAETWCEEKAGRHAEHVPLKTLY